MRSKQAAGDACWGRPDWAQMVSSGAHGIFLKHNPAALLVQSVRAVMDGRTWIDPRYWQALQRGGDSSRKVNHKPRLSEREQAVLQGVLEGLSNKEIAARLEVSETSVKAAVQQLCYGLVEK